METKISLEEMISEVIDFDKEEAKKELLKNPG